MSAGDLMPLVVAAGLCLVQVAGAMQFGISLQGLGGQFGVHLQSTGLSLPWWNVPSPLRTPQQAGSWGSRGLETGAGTSSTTSSAQQDPVNAHRDSRNEDVATMVGWGDRRGRGDHRGDHRGDPPDGADPGGGQVHVQGEGGPFSSWVAAGFSISSTARDAAGGLGALPPPLSPTSPEKGIVFNLHTRNNPMPTRLYANDAATLKGSSFRAKRPTTFVIHGYTSHAGKGSGCDLVKDALLRAEDMNVITVDWSGVDTKVYPFTVVNIVPMVGEQVAVLIKALIEQGAAVGDFHIIGHSLGSHIAGAAGSHVLGPAGAGRVTGLDPAGPMYEGKDEASRLDPSDAGFVDAIHTDGGFLGIVQPVAHVDFFVDGGMHKLPACGSDINGICSHCFVYEIFADAVDKPNAWLGSQCDSMASLKRGDCMGKEQTSIGLQTSRKSRGSFFVESKIEPSENLKRFGKNFLASGFTFITTKLITGEDYIKC